GELLQIPGEVAGEFHSGGIRLRWRAEGVTQLGILAAQFVLLSRLRVKVVVAVVGFLCGFFLLDCLLFGGWLCLGGVILPQLSLCLRLAASLFLRSLMGAGDGLSPGVQLLAVAFASRLLG